MQSEAAGVKAGEQNGSKREKERRRKLSLTAQPYGADPEQQHRPRGLRLETCTREAT